MGTNYYIETTACKSCGHSEGDIHLGKSSIGWRFNFQYNGGRYYKNVREMKEWLKNKQIWNEYGEEVPHEEFWELVKLKQDPEYTKNNPDDKNCEFEIDGYVFSDYEFS